jgi:hypothetical protein
MTSPARLIHEGELYVRAADLIGTAEFAEIAGVTPKTVVVWATRHETFPEPVAVLANGMIRLRSEAVGWLEDTERL